MLVRGDRIEWVGPAQELPGQAGEPRLDLGNVTLLPGLIDMHNHLRISHAEGGLADQMRDPEVPYVLHALRHLEQNLRTGVTTMKSNGDRAFLDVQMREALTAGLARGPRLFVAGADRGIWLCVTLGVLLHPHGDMARRLQGPEGAAIRRRLGEIQETMAEAVARGVRYVLGTDAVHGCLAFELQALNRLGAGPADLLRAATAEAGAALGRANTLGTLRPGAFADLIAVQGDPLAALSSLERVTWVMQAGQVLCSSTEDRAADR